MEIDRNTAEKFIVGCIVVPNCRTGNRFCLCIGLFKKYPHMAKTNGWAQVTL